MTEPINFTLTLREKSAVDEGYSTTIKFVNIY